MQTIEISSHEELENLKNQDLEFSAWHTIDQEQINNFANATLDYQWIHTNAEKAKNESPFGSTIAHGYLTLSLLPYLWNQIIQIKNCKMQVNYSIENLRFNQAVKVNSQVRLIAKLNDCVNLRGVSKASIHIKLEIKDSPKPAYEGDIIFLYHFNHN